MKNSSHLYIILCFCSLWGLLNTSVVYGQDVSINILSVPATLPLSTTGIIQVDLCNTDPTNAAAPVDKLRPQVSVGSNVTILGVTNTDGSPNTDFTVLSNSGQTISLSNAVPLANSNCMSFNVIVRGAVIDTPGSVGDIIASLDSQTANNQTYNDNSISSVAVIVNPVPDLAPIISVVPSLIYGSSPINVVVDVLEINSVPTNEVVTVKIVRDAMLILTFNPTANLVGGHLVQNSAWSFDDSDLGFYVLKSLTNFPAKGKLSFGLSGVLNSGNTIGILSISSTIAKTIGELNIINNSDADKIEYFK